MAEILDENVERFQVDTPSGNGNTVLGTADPSKFPNAVKDSISIEPNIPNKLDKILNKDEKFDKLEDDPDALKSHIMSKVK